MDIIEEILIPNFPKVCRICSIDNNLIQINEDNNLFTLFIQITKDVQEKFPINICLDCLQELKSVYDFINVVKWKSNNQKNYLSCIVCSTNEDLTLLTLTQNSIAVFQDFINFKLDCNKDNSVCNKCLNKLQKITNFITMSKQNNKSFITKNESLEVFIKEEPSDDEFVETPTKIEIKNEPNIFSYENLETNNNHIIKKEAIDEIECKYEDQKQILKVEIDEEGIQYNCNEKIKIDCPFCNKPFDTAIELLSHMKQRSRCRYQKRRVANTWKNVLKKVSKPFKCQVCLKYFSTIEKKKQHIKNHFKSSVICQYCGKIFLRQVEYFKHFTIHVTKQLPVKCKFCPKKLKSKFLYNKHILKHKKRTFKCKICFCTFSKSKLKTHNKQDKKSCSYCNKKFCMKTQLSIHLRSHTGERPFQCAVCSRCFSVKGNLMKHCRTHNGYKPYSCKICLKNFARTDYLNKHLLTTHKTIYDEIYEKCKTGRPRKLSSMKKDEEEVACNICLKKCNSKQSLTAHLRVHNKEKKFKCQICSKTFLYKGLLNGHLKIHQDNKPFTCSLCPKRFIKRNDLTRHTYTHTKEKNYKCEICYDKFSRKDVLRLHIRGHVGLRPYKCDNCSKTFVQKCNLTQHKKRCHLIFSSN